MKENTTRTAPRAFLAVSTLGAAVALGYGLRGTPLTAQNVDPNTSTKTPVVLTPATNEAAGMQKAFNEVSRAIEPAVVTLLTTVEARRTSTSGRAPRGGQQGNPFGAPGDLEEFFRRFGGGGLEPNSAEREQLRGLWREQQARRGGGLGSGMIYRADGYIITNAHVVAGARTVNVTLNSGREYKNARVLGADERTDIAVIKIDGDKLPTVRLGDSGNVNVGDWAIAVGNPFGLEHTVTVGVISAKAREVPLSERGPNDYLQTDASINPGNSGGPLCNIRGEVVGVNNAIYSPAGGNVGIGFAIPINTARTIADQLARSGRVVRGYLGVGIDSIEDAQTAVSLELPASTRGVLVGQVSEDAPGARAGLQPGDVITRFNGKAVTRAQDLQRLVGEAAVNSTATLTVLRGGQTRELRATLSELKDEPRTAARPEAPAEEDAAGTPTALGLRAQPITPQRARQFNLKDGTRGVVITGVDENSPAANVGIQRGDVIERVGQTSVSTPQELQGAVTRLLARQAAGEKTVGLFINRAGTRSFTFVTVE